MTTNRCYLMMAGAEAVRIGASPALTLTRDDLAERAANRERGRLNRLTSQWGHSEHLIAHLVMCVTLQGGCSAEEALQLAIEERHAMGFPETVPAIELVNQLAEALPGPSGAEVDAVRPDLIGEAFLLRGMEEYHRFPRVQADIVERAWRRADRKVVAILVHSAQDYAQGDADHVSVVWLRHLLDLIDDFTALVMLAAEVPQRTLALREFAAAAEERVNATVTEAARRDRSFGRYSRALGGALPSGCLLLVGMSRPWRLRKRHSPSTTSWRRNGPTCSGPISPVRSTTSPP